ncbi:uroporphyrinogen-III C-methyltransferase [Caulobacter vibrioides]|uniref:uroporphyrinogen-III C-methyltransferase n=2 Tax=Caulobacter vibrioides TaxID=155892 RepID=Q9A976_CAUVC|nr:uroporphyrinogen-III C-methyltransferase [Caulobacter vibrioides]YP_002516548.1 uroporphyrin-III C-methyltransferase [Caulobacter vibrioides NA1000]AAK23102.1 sirohaem synthase [Caulobacter vibrioides CB15]ACL94640.1 uroporphyrin-III C-methyltransferase [Caulobacter vibrioides NA1000]ATC27946.1 uroporphyrinogen-III C-methyltransferase [Caulobacter vibrioides]QXZ53200.1 uroporphyrinogen-III C-methyltransferase [Caulobacter vibrioides]
MARQPVRNRPPGLVVVGGKRAGRALGVVWLVGAGPGDPDLLTFRAFNALRAADVVVHDGLVSEEILDLAPSRARRINVAKRKSRHTLPQDDINQLLVALAQEGLTVVRLKGGDPFLFGRGGEELAACREAGVECHVVPGVTAALAASAGAGAPLTHRGAAQAVTFVTGHAAHGEPDLDWVALARPNQTVVVYMGVSTAALIAERLVAAGRAASTRALIVENASRADERRILTTLSGLAEAAASVRGPALLMVGEAMAMAEIQSPPPLTGEGHREAVEGALAAKRAPSVISPLGELTPPPLRWGGEFK